jgi:D-sedoheptulose 7-phosphate isomerase
VLVAISSSGKSKNILNAALAAREKGCRVITLSAFSHNNPLASLGDFNIFVAAPQKEYGIAENAHSEILHAILDHIASKINTEAV